MMTVHIFLQNLAYFAVQEVLEILTPNFYQWDQYTVQNWVRKLHRISNGVETVLSFKTTPESQAEDLRITNRFVSNTVHAIFEIPFQ